MPLLALVALYGVVHLLGLFVLRCSGVYVELFGADRLIAPADDHRIAGESSEWIDNHEFWDLPDDEAANEFWDDADVVGEAGGHLRAVDF